MKLDVKEQIPVRLIREMQHAIGWGKNRVIGTKHRVMHAYRNRFCTHVNEGWENLCFFGLAECYERGAEGISYYCLTRVGMDFLGELCGIKIVEVD